MKIRKSQIQQAFNGNEQEDREIFKKTMSPYLTSSNEIMEGLLSRLEDVKMTNYYSIKLLEKLIQININVFFIAKLFLNAASFPSISQFFLSVPTIQRQPFYYFSFLFLNLNLDL